MLGNVCVGDLTAPQVEAGEVRQRCELAQQRRPDGRACSSQRGCITVQCVCRVSIGDTPLHWCLLFTRLSLTVHVIYTGG